MSAAAAIANPNPADPAAPSDDAEGAEVEGAPGEGEQTEETAPEGAPVEGEAPAEGEQPAAEPEIPEEKLKTAAEKYAAEALKRANQTMAAARRAEARTEAVKNENRTLKEHVGVYAGFVERLRKGDPGALAEVGFRTVREFLDAVTSFGETKSPTADDRVSQLEKQLQEQREADARAKHEAVVAEQQKLVFDHVGADKARWHYLSTARGRDELWTALGEYVALHGDISDAAVDVVADAVEADMRAEFGAPPKISAPRPGVPNGATPAATGRTSTKTLTHKGASSAPGASEYPLDPEERRRAVNARLKADGLI